MATFAINPTGLRVRPTYESLTNYIVNQPMISFPDKGHNDCPIPENVTIV